MFNFVSSMFSLQKPYDKKKAEANKIITECCVCTIHVTYTALFIVCK